MCMSWQVGVGSTASAHTHTPHVLSHTYCHQPLLPVLQARMREQGVAAEHGHKRERQEQKVPDGVPRALHRFFKQ